MRRKVAKGPGSRARANSCVKPRMMNLGGIGFEVAVKSRVIGGAKRGGVMALCAFLLGGCADMPLFHEPATLVGFATTQKETADFVSATHPEKTDFTSVGVEPGHPPDKPRDKDGIKQLQAELEAQRDTGHSILQKLSPETANAQTKTPDEKAKAKQAVKAKAKDATAIKEKGQVPEKGLAPQEATGDAPAEAPAAQ
jgi:hypothetical protein